MCRPLWAPPLSRRSWLASWRATDDQCHGAECPPLGREDLDAGGAHQVLGALVHAIVDRSAEDVEHILRQRDPQLIAADVPQEGHRRAAFCYSNRLAEGTWRVRERAE